MMVLAKLKPVASAVVAVLGVVLGVGTAALPTAAGQSPPPTKQPLAHVGPLDDDAFLRRACTDIRGTQATDIERSWFKADVDPKKRIKVVEWLLSEPSDRSAWNREERKAIVEWVLQADGSVRADDRAVEKGIEWLGRVQSEKINLNDLPAVVLDTGKEVAFDRWTKRLLTVDTPKTWDVEIVKDQPVADGKKYVVKPDAPKSSEARWTRVLDVVGQDDPQEQEAAKRRLEQFQTLMDKPANDAKRAEAARAQLDVQEARAAVAARQTAVDKMTADRTKVPDKVIVSAELAKIDLEVAKVQLNQAQARLDLVLVDKAGQAAQAKTREEHHVYWDARTAQTPDDTAFLRRVLTETLGTAPTALEQKYFAADKDPKKREKLVDLLLKNANVAKKVGPEWRSRVLGLPVPVKAEVVLGDALLVGEAFAVTFRTADAFAKLLDQVLDGKRSDEQIADAICLATVGRFPTETEQKMAIATAAGAKEKRVGWSAVAAAFAGTKEAQAHAEALKKK
jgi:hypothetical protein